ncbi:hypothetical protein SEPCBS119000_000261 [Sporothrix epigloea]|uniref:Uncharacterized protein n=1 Tax=Sporothrix epigloea TaxID=1892477 RepID=A0ABP0D464_9PEZI
MPATFNAPATQQWRESWPPAQIHLESTAVLDSPNSYSSTVIEQTGSDDKSHLHDDNPLIYFLSPTPPLLSVNDDGESYFDDDSDSSCGYSDNHSDDDDGLSYNSAVDIELDAGIEDTARPQAVVRNVGPSSLADNIGRAGRFLSSDTRSTVPFWVENHSPLPSVSFTGRSKNKKGVSAADYESISKAAAKGKSTAVPISPRPLPKNDNLLALLYSNKTVSRPTATRALTVRRRSPRSWRAPSLNVFSIEEEEENERELPSGTAATDRQRSSAFYNRRPKQQHHFSVNAEREDIKPQRTNRVRFLLPGDKAA